MSLSPEDDLSDRSNVPTPKINLHDDFISSQQEKMDVYLRIRPLLPAEILQDDKPCICVEDSHAVRAVAPLESAKFKSSAHDNSALEQIFRFTRTFGPEVNQIHFFEETMKTTLENFIRGQNELVFAYGSTGSGKTYTMQGGLAHPGVIPLTIHLLFCSIKGKQVTSPTFKPQNYSDVIKLSKSERVAEEAARQKLLSHLDSEDFDDTKSLSGKSSVSAVFSDDSLNTSYSHLNLTNKEISILESTLRMKNTACESVSMQGEILFSIWVSFVEIYNENIFDLLEPVTANKRARLSLKEDENKNIYVRGLKEIRVTSSEEALKLFSLGKRNLRIASTKLNYQSSRSHCIFSIKAIRVLSIDSPLSARVNRLSFCDLAGSERSAKTQNTGMRLKEAGNINKSLMVLGRCIEALRQQELKDKKVIPYRESKLTRLFSGFFTGKGKASMIINISPSSHIFDETLNALKFSALAKQVVSNDLSIKPLSELNEKISRLTEAWQESTTRWSSFCGTSVSQNDSTDEIAETSMEDENDIDVSFKEINQRDGIIEELLGHIKTLTDELKKVHIEKLNLESEIRAQVRREFAENFVEIDNCYREQRKDLEESDLTINRGVHKKRKNDMSKDADEEDNVDDYDEDTEGETGYTSAHEDTPPPVLTKEIQDSETEMLEDKDLQVDDLSSSVKSDSKSGRSNVVDGKSKSSQRKTKDRRQNSTLKDSEVKKYENLLSSRDAVIEKLQREIENRNDAVISLKKELQESQNFAKSKDSDLAALRTKLQEAELSYDKDIVEYEKILSSKGEEVIKMKQSIQDKDATISSHENEVKELKNVICKSENDLAHLRKKFESEVSSKEKELKECLKSLNARVQEVTELKGEMEEMEKVIASKEKQLQEYVSVMNLKDVEISFLAESDVGRKANGVKQYETALRCKDEEISELKKTVEAERCDLMNKEKELEGYRNSMNLKDNELAQLKKKLQENGLIVPKEDELRDCEIKDAEINKLKKAVEMLQEDVTSKEKEIQDLKNIIILKNTEVHLLKEKICENEVIIAKPNELAESEAIVKSKDESIARLKKEVEGHRKTIFLKDKELEKCRNMLNCREKELSSLKDKIEEQEVVIPKSTELKEYKKSLNSKEAELVRLKKRIDELQESVISKDDHVKALEKKIEETEEILSSKNAEVCELHQRLSEFESIKAEDGRVKVREKESRKSEEMLGSNDKEIAALQQKMAEVNKALLRKAPQLQNVQYLTELVQESFQKFVKQNVEIATMQKDYNALLEEFEGSKKLIQQEFNKKFEEQENSLSKKNAEIDELESKLAKEQSVQQELNLKLEKQEESLASKNAELKELELKLAEEAKSKEKYALSENQRKTFGELVMVLQKVEFQAYSRVSQLEQKLLSFKDELNTKNTEIQNLISRVKEEEEKERQRIEEEKERQKARDIKERQRIEEERERQKAQEEKERQRAEEEEERRRAEEERERRRAEEEEERRRAEEEKKAMRAEKEIQTENWEIKKHEREVQTENFQNQSEAVLPEYQNFQTAERSTDNIKILKEFHSEEVDVEAVTPEVHGEDSFEVFDADDAESCKKSAVSLEELQKRLSFAECLVHILQKLEHLATETIIRLNTVNSSYCEKLLDISENYNIMRTKLAAAEKEIIETEDMRRKMSKEDSSFKPKKVSVENNQESVHLIDILQKIEQASTRKINYISDDNLRLLHENEDLLEQVQTCSVELGLTIKEIEKKDQEYSKIEAHLRKRNARILLLEKELNDAQKKISNMETRSKIQLLEERTQHGIEVEGVMALKRQAETDYRSLERKFVASPESTEEPRPRKKQTRAPRHRGRKRSSPDQDKDFEPRQKKRMVKSQVYFEEDEEEDSVSLNSLEAEDSQITEAPSSLQRLKGYVTAKSPAIKAVADRVKTFLSPRSDNTENRNTSTMKNRKKLFNNSCAPSLICSPVQETVTKISPKKTVKRRFRSKKDSK